MKSLTLIAIAAIATPALAQAGLPQCAINCAISALPSQCAITDVACICEQTSYIESLEPCVESSCSAADQSAALSGAVALCASAGVTLSIPGTTSSTPAPATSAPASSAPATSGPAYTSTSTSAYTSTYTPTMTTATTTASAKTNSSNTTTSSSPVFTGAASSHTYVSGALIAGIGALIAFF